MTFGEQRSQTRANETPVELRPQFRDDMIPSELRHQIRSGEWHGPTSACCGGYVQANLVIVPGNVADDFAAFCSRNPKSCPLLEKTDPGRFDGLALAAEADLRTDVPGYRVYRDGAIAAEPTDLLDIWRDDLVSFLLGCSFTFDAALQRAGVAVRHIDEGRNVPMYVTNRDCIPAGPFAGPLVVSMRPVQSDQVKLVAEISGKMPLAHGAPVHAGDPLELGISDIARPDFGDAVTVASGEIPMFWACGTTPQRVAMHAGTELMITHAPGHMFVTDVRDSDLERWDPRSRIQPNENVGEKR